jgi:sulfatase maturation enzyme AslB (radical SAM superfamily)
MRIEESNNESLDLIFPIPFERVGVEINQRCNLHCKYCWNQKWNNREIEEEKIQKIFSALYQSSLTWGISNNPIHVCFYAAEPMLSADLIKKIIKYPFYYSFLTNGTLLDKNYDWLAARNLSVSVSLDGIKENHNYFRGDFDKIVNNIIHYPY